MSITDADFVITKADLVLENKLPMLKRSRSDSTKLVNFVDVRYRRRFNESRSLTAYDKTVNAQNLASIAAKGEKGNPEMFMMDFIRKNTMAEDIALYYAERLSNLRRIIEFTTKRHRLEIAKDDSISFTLT